METYDNLPWRKKLVILQDVCCGLQYLHSRNPPIIHCDLTPNNILLCDHLRAKISDPGVAKAIHTKMLTQAPGANDFMPPESLSSKPVYGLPLDIFSFGGVILYVCTQEWPQLGPLVEFDPNTGERIVLTEIKRRQQHLNEMVGVCKDLKPLVISCLDDNPRNRPSAAETLMKIKKAKDACNVKMSSHSSAAVVTDNQLTTQPKNQQKRLSHFQQEEQEDCEVASY